MCNVLLLLMMHSAKWFLATQFNAHFASKLHILFISVSSHSLESAHGGRECPNGLVFLLNL